MIERDKPSFIAVEKNAELLASFARECQSVGLVPIVESDVVRDGDYTAEKDIEVTDRVLTAIFAKLEERHVDLAGCLLKTNMILAGKKAVIQPTADEVGMATAAVLKHAVPKYLAGVLLLSGGQEATEATKNLAAIKQTGPFPWPESFAFGRALQDSVMATWKG